MNNIYSYRNYRKYLEDFYRTQKTQTAGYGYAKFSEAAKLGSPNYLKLVIDGKRKLTPANIQSFAIALKLEGKELDYFEALVLANQAETKLEKSYYSNRLKSILLNLPRSPVLRKLPTRNIRNQEISALRLLCDGKDIQQAIVIVENELQISKEQAKASIEDLLESADLLLNDQGRIQLNAKHIMSSDRKGFNEAQRLLLSGGLEEARNVFNERYVGGCAKFLSILLTAEAGSLPLMFADLRESIETVAAKYDPDPDQQCAVYRAQIQLYRLRKNEN